MQHMKSVTAAVEGLTDAGAQLAGVFAQVWHRGWIMGQAQPTYRSCCTCVVAVVNKLGAASAVDAAGLCSTCLASLVCDNLLCPLLFHPARS